MKLKFELEIDTDNIKDEERLEEILALLRELKELIDDSRNN